MTTRHAGVALQAAAAIPDKGIKVPCRLELVDMIWVIGTNHRKSLSHCIILLQHTHYLHKSAVTN